MNVSVSATISNLNQKWRALSQSLGWVWAGCYVLHLALKKIGIKFQAYRFAYQPIPLARKLAVPPNIVFKWVDSFHADLLVEDRKEHIVKARLARGDLCLAAYKESEMVAFIWLATSHYPEDDTRCDYQLASPPLVWDYDVYVAPKYRVTRLFAQLWEEANDYLRARQIHWSVSRISAFNAASIRAHVRSGAKLTGTALFWQMGQMQLLMSSQKPFVHLSRQSRPIFQFNASKPF